MILNMEFDTDQPFDFEFGDWLLALLSDPNAVKYTQQDGKTEEEKAQARKNLGITTPLQKFENTDNRVTAIDSTADDEHYPTAKAVRDYVGQNGGGSASTPDHSMYFDIDVDGLISLKPEYRGDTTDYYVNTGKYTFSESDRGIGMEGSKISELPERLVIPDDVNGEMVTGFQRAIFCCNKRIKEVVLPSSVKEIAGGTFCEAHNLEKVENTEHIETLASKVFECTRIEEIRFPNLSTMGNQVFTNCSCLRLVDIGKVASIGNRAFEYCDNLSVVLGGENVKTISQYAFHATRRLKNLSFLGNVTNISGGAFFSSGCDFEEVYPTLVANGCTFEGKIATYKSFNDTDYWSEVKKFTPCRNQLNTLFHQLDPRWRDVQIGNQVDEEGKPLTYGYNGCALIVLAEIYSAFENVPFDSPEEFTQILENKGLLLDYRYPDGWCQMAEGLGYTVVHIDTMTKENLQTVYEALAQGALAYRAIAAVKDTTPYVNGGHAILAYGINSEGELLTANSSPHCYNLGIYENHKAAWHIYKHGNKDCRVVIVKKKEE